MARDYANRRDDRQRSKRQSKSTISPWILMGVLIGIFIAGMVYFKMQHAHMFAQQMAETQQAPAEQKPATPAPTKSPQPQFDFYTVLSKDGDKSAPTEVAPITSPKPQMNPAELLPKESVEEKTVTKPAAPQQQPVAPTVTKEPPVITVPLPPVEEAPKVDNRQQVLTEEKHRLEQEIATAMPASKVAKTTYLVVMGTFKNYSGADELRAQLALQSIEADIKRIQKNGSNLFRVCLGPYTTLKAAQKQQQQLQANQIKSVLVKENQP